MYDDPILELTRASIMSMLAGFMLWRILFWHSARGCGYCGARRPDRHAKNCPFKTT